jgi:hypothetical protein
MIKWTNLEQTHDSGSRVHRLQRLQFCDHLEEGSEFLNAQFHLAIHHEDSEGAPISHLHQIFEKRI